MVETIRPLDLNEAADASALLTLLNLYAADPMGGGEPIAEALLDRLIPALRSRSDYLGIIALHDATPVGLINCFEGFSTFAAQPLLNIHDVVVVPAVRGCGLAQRMLAVVETAARARGCCKLTLEVLSNNHSAQRAYRKFGFDAYQLDPQAGEALFWQKKILSV